MKATIFGAGKMGVAIAYSMLRLGFDVLICEPHEKTLNSARETLLYLQSQPRLISEKTIHFAQHVYERTARDFFIASDIVISAASYFANVEIAQLCCDNRLKYCDLGGSPEVSAKIAEIYKDQGLVCLTDLGLAPGFVNMIAGRLVDQSRYVKSVEMRVGGVPETPCNTLGYNIVFSVEGLRNEYTGKCDILRNCAHAQVDALSEVDEVEVLGRKFESFHTRGGIGSSLEYMRKKGIVDCSYKTLRYPGHVQYIKFMFDDLRMDDDVFDTAMNNMCQYGYQSTFLKRGVVYVDVRLGYYGKTTECFSLMIRDNQDWTAMQQSTAFPAAAAASCLAHMKLKDDCKDGVLAYHDVRWGEFASTLSMLVEGHPWECTYMRNNLNVDLREI